MKPYRRELIFMAVLALTAIPVKLILAVRFNLDNISLCITSLLYIAIAILWADSVRRRFLKNTVRHIVYLESILIAGWLIIRFVKYILPADPIYMDLSRHLWYLYYVPMILLPTVGFLAVLHIGRLGLSPLSNRVYLVYIPISFITAGVLTNDLHQAAFKFPEGFENASGVYTYGPIYYMAVAVIGLSLVGIIALCIKRYLTFGLKYVWIPIALLAVGIIYLFGYANDHSDKILLQRMYELPEFMCLYIIAFQESAVISLSDMRRQVALNLEPQLSRLQEMLYEIPADAERFREHMKYAAILNVYIKRRSNLLLIGEDGYISAQELELALAESIEYLRLLGVTAHLEFDISDAIRSDVIIFLYALYEDALELALDNSTSNAILIIVDKRQEKLYFYMEVGAPKAMLPAEYKRAYIRGNGGNLKINNEDGTEFITFTTPYDSVVGETYDSVKAKGQRQTKVLDTKKDIHDDVGRALLALRSYLTADDAADDEAARNSLIELWQEEINIFRTQTALRDSTDPMAAMFDAANAIGVKLVIYGELPTDEKIRYLVAQATRECITNTVKHAKGNTLYIETKTEDGKYIIEFTNDGEKPHSQIWETGGLRTLRANAENAGLKMSISTSPRYILRLVQ